MREGADMPSMGDAYFQKSVDEMFMAWFAHTFASNVGHYDIRCVRLFPKVIQWVTALGHNAGHVLSNGSLVGVPAALLRNSCCGLFNIPNHG
jgi:hypothetical protein